MGMIGMSQAQVINLLDSGIVWMSRCRCHSKNYGYLRLGVGAHNCCAHPASAYPTAGVGSTRAQITRLWRAGR